MRTRMQASPVLLRRQAVRETVDASRGRGPHHRLSFLICHRIVQTMNSHPRVLAVALVLVLVGAG